MGTGLVAKAGVTSVVGFLAFRIRYKPKSPTFQPLRLFSELVGQNPGQARIRHTQSHTNNVTKVDLGAIFDAGATVGELPGYPG
jgi:hypothetical protein